MSKKVHQVMTPTPAMLDEHRSCADAATMMRERNIGAMIVTDKNGTLCGIVTDRDLVVRCMAAGLDPTSTELADICSHQIAKLSPDDDVHDAVELMKKKAIRRIPVLDHGRPVGIISLGDLAIAEDPESALGGISRAQPNR